MGFFDDLKRTVDSVLGVPAGRGILGEDQYLNRDGVHPMSGEGLKAPDVSPHSLNLADAIAIQQQRSTAFSVTTITPARLNAANYQCTLSTEQINNVVGLELDTTWNPINSWRSVTLPIMGNFLKIDGAIAKLAESSIYNPNLNIPDTDEEHSQLSSIPGLSNNSVLIQFGENTAPVLLARFGDTFETPYNSITVSFKYGAPKFSLITGYNSKIVSSGGRNNFDLATGTNRELWNYPTRHCVPWAYGYNGTSGIVGGQNFGGTSSSLTIAASSNQELVIFQQYLISQAQGTSVPDRVDFKKGVGVGWITSIDFYAASNSTRGQTTSVTYSGIVTGEGTYYNYGGLTSSMSWVPNMGNSKGRFSIVVVNSAGTVKHILFNCPFVSETSYVAPMYHLSKTFPVPIRFVLAPGDKLSVYIHNWDSGNTMDCGFSLAGYAYGTLYGPVNGSSPDGTIHQTLTLAPILDDPYPLDFKTVTSTGP